MCILGKICFVCVCVSPWSWIWFICALSILSGRSFSKRDQELFDGSVGHSIRRVAKVIVNNPTISSSFLFVSSFFPLTEGKKTLQLEVSGWQHSSWADLERKEKARCVPFSSGFNNAGGEVRKALSHLSAHVFRKRGKSHLVTQEWKKEEKDRHCCTAC